MNIYLNERKISVSHPITLGELKANHQPEADLLICNGGVADSNWIINENDHVHLIKRGDIPSEDELEGLMIARHTPGVHQKIKGATVGIAGLGGLGSAIAVALARIGVGRLILADFDVVEPSNLNRQQYFVDQIGQLKTDALSANLSRINPYITIVTHPLKLTEENIPIHFSSVDVMIEAFDRADQKAMLFQTWASNDPNKPLVGASGMAGYGPGETIRVQKMGRNLYIIGDLETEAQPGCGLMAPRVGIAAHMQANTALRLLLGEI